MLEWIPVVLLYRTHARNICLSLPPKLTGNIGIRQIELKKKKMKARYTECHI